MDYRSQAEKYPFTVSPVPPEEGKGYYLRRSRK